MQFDSADRNPYLARPPGYQPTGHPPTNQPINMPTTGQDLPDLSGLISGQPQSTSASSHPARHTIDVRTSPGSALLPLTIPGECEDDLLPLGLGAGESSSGLLPATLEGDSSYLPSIVSQGGIDDSSELFENDSESQTYSESTGDSSTREITGLIDETVDSIANFDLGSNWN